MAKESITVYDAQGAAREIPRAEFAEKVLPQWLKGAWNDPNTLAQQIAFGLNEGCHAVLLDAARRLDELDQGNERGRVLLSATLLQNGQLEEAEDTLRSLIGARGESAVSVVNLARVRSTRGDAADAEKLLARALELDPNQENALGWSCQIAQQRGGEPAVVAALETMAQTPANWRAKLWLASQRVRGGKVDEGLALYREAMPQAVQDPSTLLNVTGELGRAGKLSEMIDVALPHYDPRRQRPEAGFNLMQALIQLDRKREAAALLDQLRALNMPPLRQAIEQFATRLGQAPTPGAAAPQVAAQAPAQQPQQQQVEIRLLNIEGPIWIQGLSGAKWLLPEKDADAPIVSVFVFGDEAAASAQTQSQIDDVRRRRTRSFPLALCEALHLRTNAKAECMLPIVPGGAVVLAGQLPNPSLFELPRKGPKPLFFVAGMIARDEGGYRIEVVIYDGTSKAEVHRVRELGARRLDGLAQRLEDEVFDWLCAHGIERTTPKAGLIGKLLVPAKRRDSGDIAVRVPPEKQDHHLLVLDHLREQFVIALGLASRETLLDERSLFDTYFDLCKAVPQSTLARAMAVAGVMFGIKYGSTSVDRYHDRLIEMLERESDPRGLLHMLSPLLFLRVGDTMRFEAAKKQLEVDASDSYREWLAALKP